MTYPGSPPYQVSSKSVMLSEFCYKQLEEQGHTTKRCIFFIMPKTEHCGYKAWDKRRGNMGEYGTKIQRKIMSVCHNITYFGVCQDIHILLTSMIMKVPFFQDAMPCRLVHTYQHFRTACSSSVIRVVQNVLLGLPWNQQCHCEKLKSCKSNNKSVED
jgi:hypothetical protein